MSVCHQSNIALYQFWNISVAFVSYITQPTDINLDSQMHFYTQSRVVQAVCYSWTSHTVTRCSNQTPTQHSSSFVSERRRSLSAIAYLYEAPHLTKCVAAVGTADSWYSWQLVQLVQLTVGTADSWCSWQLVQLTVGTADSWYSWQLVQLTVGTADRSALLCASLNLSFYSNKQKWWTAVRWIPQIYFFLLFSRISLTSKTAICKYTSLPFRPLHQFVQYVIICCLWGM